MSEQSAAKGPQQQLGQQPPQRAGRRLTAAAIALAGGLLTAGALTLASYQTSTGTASDLSIVAVADIGAAAQTIDPAVSSQLAAGARSCSTPLAHVTIAKVAGAAGGTIRIRSGNYVSPPFALTDAPQRVAIPFPAPYPLGHGAISIEGTASGALISLRPGWTVASLNGSAVRNVVWKVGNPCQ